MFKCLAAVEKAFNTVDAMLTGHRPQLKQDFNLCTAISTNLDVYTFVSGLADIFMSAVQYNSRTSPNVRQLCQSMLAPGTPYQNLVNIHKVIGQCILMRLDWPLNLMLMNCAEPCLKQHTETLLSYIIGSRLVF